MCGSLCGTNSRVVGNVRVEYKVEYVGVKSYVRVVWIVTGKKDCGVCKCVFYAVRIRVEYKVEGVGSKKEVRLRRQQCGTCMHACYAMFMRHNLACAETET